MEYCEYHPNYDKCKAWLEKNFPALFKNLSISGGKGAEQEEDTKKRQKRGEVQSFQACKGDTNPTIIKGLWAEIEIITVMNNFAKQLRNLLFHKSKYHKIKNPSQKFLRPYQV